MYEFTSTLAQSPAHSIVKNSWARVIMSGLLVQPVLLAVLLAVGPVGAVTRRGQGFSQPKACQEG